MYQTYWNHPDLIQGDNIILNTKKKQYLLYMIFILTNHLPFKENAKDCTRLLCPVNTLTGNPC